MKIAIFIDSLAIGGAQKHVRQLACGLTAEGHEVSVFVLNEIVEDLYREPLCAAGVQVEVIGRRAVLSGVGLVRVAWRLWTRRYGGVITVLFVSTVFGRCVAQLAGGIPVVTSLQARNIDYAAWQNAVLRATSRLTAFTLSNSRSALRWAARHEGLDLRTSAFVPNAADPIPPVANLPSWADLGFPDLEGKRVVGSLGRLHRQKGYDLLLDAVALLSREERASIRLVIFGEGPERANLQAKTNELGLRETVLFAGKRRNAADLLPKFDLYVQPSRFEGTPNSVIEALAAGVPAVCSAVDGMNELGAIKGLTLLPPADVALWTRELRCPSDVARGECILGASLGGVTVSIPVLSHSYEKVLLAASKNFD